MPDGRPVTAFVLANAAGLEAVILTLGAIVQALRVPDRHGRSADIVLGYADPAGYLDSGDYMGATVGRVANRIAGGRFALDGQSHRVPPNEGPHALHGGPHGFDRALWEPVAHGAAPDPFLLLRHVSPDGDQGFPGTLEVTAHFELAGDTLAISYAATTDRPTLVNLSHHGYWNLAGEGAPGGALGQLLTIAADRFAPIDDQLIPLGVLAPVAGTAFDFRRPTPPEAHVRDARDAQIRAGRGFDHAWVFTDAPTVEVRDIARLTDPASGRTLTLRSNQPSLQFYSGNFLDGSRIGKSGRCYRQGDAIVLEPQMLPDTPNRPEFGSVRLAPGEVYRNLIRFRFGTDG
jgi:aldose 1-epimerase